MYDGAFENSFKHWNSQNQRNVYRLYRVTGTRSKRKGKPIENI